ncbi:MAG: TIGR03087 family PEP-CTERM/XrtA system glycosyltransferase [Desulfuromonadaceae bacterium]|nr:TIGR03087 family PEP-CTERM/XrtA system glycosyltransferase [Desulfuromonadaceae bacterium]
MKKDILILAHRIPYPPDKGDKIRTYHMLHHLAQHYRVTLVCLIDDPEDCRHIPVLQQMVHQCHYLVRTAKAMRLYAGVSLLSGRSFSQQCFYATKLQRAVDTYLETQKPTAILCFCSSMADYVFRSRHWPERFAQITLLDDLIDVDSEKWLQYAEKKSGFMRWLYRREARLVRALEQRIVSEFERVFLVSAEEKQVLGEHMPVDNVEALSNGVDLDYFSPAKVDSQHFSSVAGKLVFSGAMDYWPNIEGAVWFAEKIFPLVKKEMPQASFCIAGRNPTPAVRALEKIAGVEVTGTVPDMREHLATATVCVVPLLIARGIQNKVLEAMAMEKPVVATRGAATGTHAIDGEELSIADTEEGMAAAIIELLGNEQRRLEMGRKARAYVEREHSWNSHLQRLSEVIGRE